MDRSEDGAEQQDDPNPWISSTGDGLNALDEPAPAGDELAAIPAPIAAWACEGPWWRGEVATAKPARGTPMTRPMASTAATGATGRRRVIRARRRGRGGLAGAAGAATGSRVASEVVTPY